MINSPCIYRSIVVSLFLPSSLEVDYNVHRSPIPVFNAASLRVTETLYNQPYICIINGCVRVWVFSVQDILQVLTKLEHAAPTRHIFRHVWWILQDMCTTHQGATRCVARGLHTRSGARLMNLPNFHELLKPHTRHSPT